MRVGFNLSGGVRQAACRWVAQIGFGKRINQKRVRQMAAKTRVEIKSPIDIIKARGHARTLAGKLGFTSSQSTLITSAISEVARNIVDYAGRGEITLAGLKRGGRQGIEIIAQDKGPGISDAALAVQYGHSSGKGLGVGLPGARWLMDEFDIKSTLGKGTTVTMKKWTRRPGLWDDAPFGARLTSVA